MILCLGHPPTPDSSSLFSVYSVCTMMEVIIRCLHVRADPEVYHKPTPPKLLTKLHVRADPEMYYMPTSSEILTQRTNGWPAVESHCILYLNSSSFERGVFVVVGIYRYIGHCLCSQQLLYF